jgi:hypothetical protein
MSEKTKRFSWLEAGELLGDEGSSFLPGPDFEFLMLPAGRKDRAPSAVEALRQWKQICDVLLPALRSKSHLHNLIYRHHPNCSLVLRYEHTVLGGVTFRLIRDKAGGDGGSVMLEVLIAAVEQRPGVCGRGYGTRLTNVLKALLARRAREFEACPLLLTQADLGLPARMFWLRQRLKESEEARRAVCDLHAWQERNIVYDHTAPMMLELPSKGWDCDPCESARAQSLEDECETT